MAYVFATLILFGAGVVWNIRTSYASHTSMCIGLPIDSDSKRSLGIDRLFPADVWKYYKDPMEKFKDVTEINPNRPTVKAYAIESQSGFVGGWLRVVVEMKDTKGFVLCGQDNKKDPIGQFSDAPFPPSCGKTLPNVKYNIIPCGGVPANEYEVPNCIVYVHPEFGNWSTVPQSPLKGEDPPPNELSFLWHFSQQPCNLKEMIHFKGYFIQTAGLPNIAIYHPWYRDFEIKRGSAFGAADPAPNPSQVSCDKLADADVPPWVNYINGTVGSWTWIYYQKNNDFEDNTGCQADLFGGRCRHTIERRTDIMTSSEVPTFDNLPKCQNSIQPLAVDGDGPLMEYDDYLNSKWTACGVSDSSSDQITTTPSSSASTNNTKRNASMVGFLPTELRMDSAYGHLIWGLRKSHAICMVFITILVTPVSAFIARYCKESLMSMRIVNLHVWDFVHIHCAFITAVALFVGMLPVLLGRYLMGSSLTWAATVHTTGGWISITIFLILGILGGVRSDDLISVCFHWFLGTCFNVFCYLLVWNSFYLPGSPIAGYDVTETRSLENSNINLIWLIVWVVMDLSLRILMVFAVKVLDSSVKLTGTRYYFPPPIPVIHKDTKRDMPGTPFRMLFLFIFFGLAFLFTAIICTNIYTASPLSRTFGPISCTHLNESTLLDGISESCRFSYHSHDGASMHSTTNSIEDV